MDARKDSCPTKAALLAAWQNAAEIYSKTVADLAHQIGVLPKSEYERLKTAAESARKRSSQAQRDMEAHIAIHGCDGNDEAAA